MAGLYPNLSLYGKAYSGYTELLSTGETYSILIAKRLLLRPLLPIWGYLLGLFCVRNSVFAAMVVLPCLLIFAIFLVMLFPLWRACHVPSAAYALFHLTVLLMLKGGSILIFLLLEALWT